MALSGSVIALAINVPLALMLPLAVMCPTKLVPSVPAIANLLPV